MSRIVREAQPSDMADIMTVMVYSVVSNNITNFLSGFLPFRARPKRIDVAHLLLHVQVDVHACGLHLVVGFDDIRINPKRP